MYVTQTYLGFTATRAKVYAYFLSETYKDDRQKHLHGEFRKRVEEFGFDTGEEVAVVAPFSGYENQALRDLDDKVGSPVQEFYRANIAGHTPGLLVCRHPIKTQSGIGGAIYFPFGDTEHPFRAAKKMINEIVVEQPNGRFITFLSHLNEVLILQPNVFGLGVNINAVMDRIIAGNSRKNE